jgi:transposase
MSFDHRCPEPAAIHTQLGAIFVSLELSRKTWLVSSVSPQSGSKMSKHSVPGGDMAGLLARFEDLRSKAPAPTGKVYPIIVIQEAGLDGFWIHRVLEAEGIESHVVDPASIATSRRRRRVKTDKIDGEALVRALLAYKRGEPRVCSMVRPPTPDEEDRRRVSREYKTLITERVQHVNRIKGLLFAQGVFDYEPLRRERRQKLETLRTGDGRPLPLHLKAQIARELDRLERLLDQIKAVERERASMLTSALEMETRKAVKKAVKKKDRKASIPRTSPAPQPPPRPQAMLMELKSIGPDFAAVLWTEGLCRSFANRRQIAAYAGLAPTPWKSGSVSHEQGISKSGNPRLRTTMIQLAWLWLRHQPDTALSRWFRERVATVRNARKKTIVALARKLLVALWKYVSAGVVIEGAVLKPAA